MRRPFPSHSIAFVALSLRQDRLPCHALMQPHSRALGATKRPVTQIRNSLDELYEDSWDDEASQAILDGQGDFFSLGSRGGDADNGHRYRSALSPTKALNSIQEGYRQRVAADPAFLSKSLLEVVLAASTQYMAEVTRRGRDRILPEIDFVFAGVLTAVCGKYYSMWRVARTVDVDAGDADNGKEENRNGQDVPESESATNWRDQVPTNAFQPTLLDGRTKPTLPSRLLAFILPMPQLFRAGVIASTIGYGLTSFLIRMRTLLIPQYTSPTQPISVPLAAIYTGAFMAVVSNVRYQLLQGIVEPYLIDGTFAKVEALGKFGESEGPRRGMTGKLKHLRHAKKVVIVLVRWANGWLGSWIAIGGMRAFGLQKLKE